MESLKDELWLFFTIVIAIILTIGVVLLPTFFIAWLLSLDGL